MAVLPPVAGDASPLPSSAEAAAPLSADAFATLMAPLGPFESHPFLAVAVSGGADSLALCLLAHDWAQARDGTAVGLTLDHGLRAEAAAEAARVGAPLTALGINHPLPPLPPPPPFRHI